jgi:hypothetical protein
MRDTQGQLCATVADVMFCFDCIGELRALRATSKDKGNGGLLPLEGILDVRDVANRAGKGGVMEVPDVRRLVQTLPLLLLLSDALSQPAVKEMCPTLQQRWREGGGANLRGSVMQPFRNVLDSRGFLSAETFGQLAKLRQKVEEISRQLAGARAGGGSKLLCEELDEAERSLNLAEHQILRGITERFAKHAAQVSASVEAAAVVDAMCARFVTCVCVNVCVYWRVGPRDDMGAWV